MFACTSVIDHPCSGAVLAREYGHWALCSLSWNMFSPWLSILDLERGETVAAPPVSCGLTASIFVFHPMALSLQVHASFVFTLRGAPVLNG